MAIGKNATPEGEAAPTRERIKLVAAELYVLRGHEGFSFADIADAIGTTRANIHHHFGNKRRLMDELIEGFTDDALARIAANWTGAGSSFAQRLSGQLADLRRFYDRFNTEPGARNVWSPLSRLRLDVAVLGEPAMRALERVDRAYDSSLRRAVEEAIAAGELAAHTPVEDVARVLRVMLLSCGPMTQDSGDFAEVERLFAAIGRTLQAAWGRKPPTRPRRA
jgi:AcrR family transcriptional regulator